MPSGNNLRVVWGGWKERQAVARELKTIYRAETAEAAARRLAEFEAGPWGKKYPMIAESCKRNWEQIIPFTVSPRRCEKSSTRPMPLKVCICSCSGA